MPANRRVHLVLRMFDGHRLRNVAAHGRAGHVRLSKAEHVQQAYRVHCHIRQSVGR